jgi:hexosaminidase
MSAIFMVSLIPFPQSVRYHGGFSTLAPEEILAGDIEFDLSLGREGYRLTIAEDSASVFLGGPEGVHPLKATLEQLWDGSGALPCVSIEDSPRFGWRGMMLDPCRHFIPMEWIIRFVDLLAYYKFNRLHLHLCEDQGWRMEIRKYPKLTEVGAWRDSTPFRPGSDEGDGIKHGGFYTQDELRELVDYASARGITIIPEIEMPGHCQAALAAYPELGNTGEQLEVWSKYGVNENVYGVSGTTIKFLEDVLEEVLAIFPSEFIHVGGDEVPKKQWKESLEAQEKMKAEGLKDEDELQSWFIKHFDRWLAARGRRLVGWDEILEGGLAKGATVMSWRGLEGGIEAAKLGHEVVMAPVQHCYFDHYQSKFKGGEPTAIGGYLPLEKVYKFEPVPAELSTDQARFVLGGQGQLWSEYFANSKQMEYMMMPRMLALTEVLWGKNSASFEEFEEAVPDHLLWLEANDWNYRPLQQEIPDDFELIGDWKVGDLTKEAQIREWKLDPLNPGKVDILFQYAGGAWAVEIDWVELSRDGELIELVTRLGRTGAWDEGNRYQFTSGANADKMRAQIRSVGDGDTLGEIYRILIAD